MEPPKQDDGIARRDQFFRERTAFFLRSAENIVAHGAKRIRRRIVLGERTFRDFREKHPVLCGLDDWLQRLTDPGFLFLGLEEAVVSPIAAPHQGARQDKRVIESAQRGVCADGAELAFAKFNLGHLGLFIGDLIARESLGQSLDEGESAARLFGDQCVFDEERFELTALFERAIVSRCLNDFMLPIEDPAAVSNGP